MPRMNAIEERNLQIYNEYKKIYSEAFLRHNKILEILSKRYFLSEQSISVIIQKTKKTVTEPSK